MELTALTLKPLKIDANNIKDRADRKSTMAEDSSEIEDKIVQEEYKVWKKNTPFLYDLVMTHALDWPSLTVQWMPQKSIPGENNVNIHKMVLGTHTSHGEPNYLMVADVSLPSADAEIDARKYDDDKVSERYHYGIRRSRDDVF